MNEQYSWSFEGRNVTIPYDVIGSGDLTALVLPALSSVSTRSEMRPLADRMASSGFRCVVSDWPGFGDQPRSDVALVPATMQSFLDAFIAARVGTQSILGIAAGHGATHLLQAATREPSRFIRLVLIAPTWRGPLPTAMGEQRRPLYRRIRQAIEAPVVGPLLYRANVSRGIVQKMLREHVYADPAFVDGERLAAKLSVTRQPRARFGTAAFVTGSLDPVQSREAFTALFGAEGLPPILVVRPQNAPKKSAAEMDALESITGVSISRVPGALAAHEEHPAEVAAVIGDFLATAAPPPRR